MGRNCVREAVLHTPSRVKTLWLQDLSRDPSPELENIRKIAAESRITVRTAAKDQLSNLVNSSSHQGVAAEVTRSELSSASQLIEALRDGEKTLIVCLDGIEDPQNLGSILRCAECFKADAVLWSKNRGCSLTPAAAKVSSGASELLLLAEVSNLADALRKFKDDGYWIIGAERREGASVLGSFDFPDKSVLIFGSEGEGLHGLSRKLLDYSIEIPLRGRLDSLNVGQAVAIVLHEWQRKCRS